MPRFSPSMTRGTLKRWLVRQGDAVAAYQLLAEIDAEGVVDPSSGHEGIYDAVQTMELETHDDGVVARLLVAEGATVEAGTPIALLAESHDAAADVAAAFEAGPPVKDVFAGDLQRRAGPGLSHHTLRAMAWQAYIKRTPPAAASSSSEPEPSSSSST